jgi:hypothetical protein
MGANPISTITGQTSAGQYGFTDPYGTTSQLQNALYGTGGAVSGGPMGTFNQNIGNVAGLSGPLQQTLTGLANYQANNALNSAGSNFANQGALGSGAAAQAFGQAIANPFAQAQAQLQQGQLGLANSLMSASGQAYGAGLGAGSNLMEHASGLVAPTNYTNPAYTTQQNMMQAFLQPGAALGKGPGVGSGSNSSALPSSGAATAGKGAGSGVASDVGAGLALA